MHKKNKNHKNKYDEEEIFKNLYTRPFTANGRSISNKYQKQANLKPLNKNRNSLSSLGLNKLNK